MVSAASLPSSRAAARVLVFAQARDDFPDFRRWRGRVDCSRGDWSERAHSFWPEERRLHEAPAERPHRAEPRVDLTLV